MHCVCNTYVSTNSKNKGIKNKKRNRAKAYMGLVEKDNEASGKCFIRNGYAEFTGGDICCYVKVL